MKPVNRQSTAELQFAVDDSWAAARALVSMPDPESTRKVRRYMDELDAARAELARRARVRCLRDRRDFSPDPLTLNLRLRRSLAFHTRAAIARAAARDLGWLRLHGGRP